MIKNGYKFLETKSTTLIFYILIAVLSILPFVLRLKLFDRSADSLEYLAFPLARGNFDIFHYYKAIWFIILSFWLVFFLFIKRDNNKSYPLNLFPLILIFLILVSSLFSPYRTFTFFGGAESFQGVLVWIGYMIICLAAMRLNKFVHLKGIANGFLVTAGIMSLFGGAQFFGIDIWKKIEFLITFNEIKLNNSPGWFQIESLFYHFNYYAGFLTMASAINIIVFVGTRNRFWRFVLWINFCLVYLNLIGSLSRTGFFSILILGVVLLIFIRKKNLKILKQLGVLTGSAIIIVIGIKVNQNTSKVANRLTSLTLKGRTNLKEIQVDKNLITFRVFEGENLYMKLVDGKRMNFFEDPTLQNRLAVGRRSDTIFLKKDAYRSFSFILDERLKNGVLFNFENEFKYPLIFEDKTIKTLDRNGRTAPIINPDKIDFLNRRHKFLTGRGMQWSLAIPVMKQSVFYGYGADSYPLVFPNNDYLSLLKTFKTSRYYVTSAHSFYLQFGIQFGILALLIPLVFIGIYCYDAIRLYWNSSFNNMLHLLGMGCFLATLGFLINGVVTAAMISNAPPFFVFLGIGIAINRKVKEELEVP